MKWCKRGLFALAVALAGAGPAAAQVKDPADLLPASTLAYVELRNPEQLSKELAGLIKGSALENLPATMAKFRAKHPDNDRFWVLQEVAMLGMFLSPEMIAEAGRLQGGAVALTGLNKQDEPEVVGFVLSGQSHAPTFFLRTYLTMDEVRQVGEVDKVPLYRPYGRVYVEPPAGGAPPPPPEVKEHGPTLALLPGAVVIGSTTDSVKEVVRRYLGKTASDSLSTMAGFKEAAKLRDHRPGLFAYADCAALVARLDGIKDKGKGFPLSDYDWSVLKEVINPKAFRHAAASLTLHNGDLDLKAHVNIDPRHKSPLLELLADKPVSFDLLHAAPKDGLVALTMSLPEGEKKWETVVSLLDAIAKVGGKPETLWPSKVLAGMEKKLNVRFGKDVAAKISGLGLALHMRGDPPKDGMRLPSLLIGATDEKAAKDLEEGLPKLIALFGKEDGPAASRETIQGYKITTVPGDDLPWGTALHLGRAGTTLVLGQERKAVAEALVAAEKKQGLLGQPKVADSLKKYDAPVLVGVWSFSECLVQAMEAGSVPGARVKAVPGPGGPGGPKPADKDEAEKLSKDLAKAAEGLPPGTIALLRKQDGLTLEVRQPLPKGVSAKVIDVIGDTGLERAYKRGRAFGGGGDLPPPPDVPVEVEIKKPEPKKD